MLTLYHSPGSSSARILWLLEELKADYRVVVVSYPRDDGSNADPRNPHPHGYTPAIEHDGRVVTESGAIALYLTDLFPNSPVGAPVGDPLRGNYVTWLFYQVGLTEPLIYMKGAKMLERDVAMARLSDAMMVHIEQTLSVGPYILGDRFTAVDILFMSLFEHARPLLPKSAILDAYIARGQARPARLKATAIDR
jgi:glutathione S-transferase